MLERGKQIVSARLPAVISVLKGINEPRYPNFLGIRKAAKAQIPVWSAADLDINLPSAATYCAALLQSASSVKSSAPRLSPAPMSRLKRLALADRLFEEKVL